ncbi:hypothetical protein NC652_015890 [Populus alba x Populus x berolinensis]|nr:hypothetical protein NC652_015890 [Populus alba x Populus x berolinensis]
MMSQRFAAPCFSSFWGFEFLSCCDIFCRLICWCWFRGKAKSLLTLQESRWRLLAILGNKVISGSKGSGAMTVQASATNSISVVYMDDFDPTVARLNIAIIWYHLHEYSKALSVLEPLYHNIEPIEERTASSCLPSVARCCSCLPGCI